MTAELDPTHPVAAAVAAVRAELGSVAGTPVWSMSASEAGESLVAVTQLAAQVAQLQMRLLAHAERVEVGADVGATSAANWLAHQTKTTRTAVHRSGRLARRLDDAYPEVDAALASGAITVEQAEVIVDAVDKLPTDLISTETVARAKDFLLTHAAEHDAKALRILGRRLLEVLDPQAADAEEARRLAAEEDDARAKASFTMSSDGHGKVYGRFTLPALHAAILRKHLMALAAPKRNPDRPADLPSRHKLGLAFLEYIESRATDTVPNAVGSRPRSWSP